jgi:hypothetical protein
MWSFFASSVTLCGSRAELDEDPDAGGLREQLCPAGGLFGIGAALLVALEWICGDADVEDARQVHDVAAASDERAWCDQKIAVLRHVVEERSQLRIERHVFVQREAGVYLQYE